MSLSNGRPVLKHMNELCHAREGVTTHTWTLHVTHMVTSHIWMSHADAHMRHGTHVNESCHTCGWVVSYTWIRHVTHRQVAKSLVSTSTHQLVRINAHDSSSRPSASVARDVTHSCVTWLIHVWNDSFICGMTHSCGTGLIHVWHDWFMCAKTQPYANYQ